MKKRVRIYKAQQGGVPQQKQISETELMDMTYKLLTAGSEPQEVLTSLVSSGVQQDLANRAISSVVEYINDEQAKMDADRNQDMDAKEDLMAEEQADQDEAMRQAEYESRQKAMQEMYYGEYEEDPGAEAEEDAVVDDLIMKTGGKMPSKRTFVRNYIKQAGGVQEDGRADSTGATERNNDLSRFVGTLKDKGNQALMKQDAEAMYESMQQDGGDVESPVMAFDPYHNLAHYSDTFEHAMPSMQTGLVQAQFGGGMTRGQERRMGRRYNRMLRNIPMGFNPGGPGMFPGAMNIYTMGNLPMQQMPAAGSYYGGVQLANIDVRRTGLFGRPKEYTINFFSPTPVTQQDVSNVIKQEENNIKETEKEVTEDKKQEEVNTSTATNAGVKEEEIKSGSPVNEAPTTQIIKGKGDDEIVEEIVEEKTYKPRSVYAYNQPAQKLDDQEMWYYSPDRDGMSFMQSGNDWYYDVATDEDQKWNKITDPERLKQLDKKLKGADLYTLPGKDGFYYRQRADGSYAKFKGDPKKHSEASSKQIAVIKPTDKNYSYLNKNRKYSTSLAGKQIGGFVDPSNPELYKFIYGGVDDLAVPMADGKLTNDPYFEYGGLVKAQRGMTTITDKFGNTKKVTADEAAVWQRSKAENPEARLEDVSFQSEKPIQRNPAIQEQLLDYNNPYIGNTYVGGPYDQYGYPQYGYAPNMRLSTLGAYRYNPMVSYAGSWAQQQGLPYDPNTGQPISGRIYNPALQSIDVKKSSWLTGAPKKYTMYFQGQGEPGTAIDKAYKPGTWYKGSDGQMQYTGDTSNKGTSSSEKSSYDPTGLSRRQRRADENYKEIYGHYPGEGRSKSETIDAPLRGIPQAEVPNLDILPGKDAYKGRTPNLTPVGKLPTRPLSPINTEGGQETIPGTSTSPAQSPEEQPIPTAGVTADSVYSGEMGSSEEYCFPGGACFSMPEQLEGDQRLFQDLPTTLLRQDLRANKNWVTGDDQLDVSKLTRQDVLDALMAEKGSPNEALENFEQYPNLNTFVDKWLEYQKGYQANTGDYNIRSLEDDVFTNDSSRPRYSDWLTAMGTPGSDPTDIFDDQGVLGMPNKKYGGILAKAQTGLNTFSTAASDIPPGYFKDPVTGLIKNFAGEVYQPKTSLTDSQTLMTNPYKFEKNTATGEEPAIKMGTEGTYENTGLLTAKDKEKQSQQQMAVDVKNKNMFNVDFQQGLDQFNKYGNMFAQMLEGKDEAARQRQLYDQLAAENIYGSTSVTKRGTYNVNSGLLEEDKMGFTGVIKYGGNIKQEGGLYSQALNEYDYFQKNPESWEGDPEMTNPDGSLNMCLDCINVDWDNEQHVRDASRLIEEGYSQGTHHNLDRFNNSLKKYNIPTPLYNSKGRVPVKPAQAVISFQEGGDMMEDDDYGYSEEEEVYMTPEEIEQFLMDGGDLEFI